MERVLPQTEIIETFWGTAAQILPHIVLRHKGKKNQELRLKCVFHLHGPGGGPAGCHGEGETGTGGDESQTVINSTLTGWEGRSPDRPAGREAETPGGGPWDEVRI